MLHKAIDAIAAFCGTALFLALNAVFFTVWIVVNTLCPIWLHFDIYPFSFLTLSVSLEAIFLSIFVLISQNRQSALDHERMEQEFQLNVKEEEENRKILTLLANQDIARAEHKELLMEVRELVQAKRQRAK